MRNSRLLRYIVKGLPSLGITNSLLNVFKIGVCEHGFINLILKLSTTNSFKPLVVRISTRYSLARLRSTTFFSSKVSVLTVSHEFYPTTSTPLT
jgi:hypothetical protein